ncbi:hypothetical protein CERZMDRAFT_94773 [Cercospora zeae-maydis SCOH1-5]|uniref:Uncharacterized protein n=1 Tax=Cercospora zeae-maydis SCOH1-5 TaxID=717836 RepID=A0A6A6FPQ5_9PEZI|nr:hypothetical protein CERZMDRAFT_94773 [Cercospora zeae-maydis SCOH1-5]
MTEVEQEPAVKDAASAAAALPNSILWTIKAESKIPQPALRYPAYVPLPDDMQFAGVTSTVTPYFLHIETWDIVRRPGPNVTTRRLWIFSRDKQKDKTFRGLDGNGRVAHVELKCANIQQAQNGLGFRAEVTDFTFNDLLDRYEDLFGSRLHERTHDVQVTSPMLFASSDDLVFTGSVTIEGHTSVSATIVVSRLELSITGLIEDVVPALDILLKEVSPNVSIGRATDITATDAGTSWKFAINGGVTIKSVSISASLVLKEGSCLSEINPDLKNTFLDLSLQDVDFIAGNVEGNSAPGIMVPAAYTIVKCAQIVAKLGPIPELDTALNSSSSPTTGLALRAIYDADLKVFELEIQFGAPQSMSATKLHLVPPPCLGLRIGIVYAGPISPNKIGLAGGLTVGKVSGQAALPISDSPMDQLVSLEIKTLDLQDVVSFASTVLQASPALSLPDNVLFSQQVKLYLSTGTTIGINFLLSGSFVQVQCCPVWQASKGVLRNRQNQTNHWIIVTHRYRTSCCQRTSGWHALTLDVRVSSVAQSVFFDGGIRLADTPLFEDVKSGLLAIVA